MTDRQAERLALGMGAVISPNQAARLLGFREALEWLEAEGLVTVIRINRRAVRRVVWASVVRRLQGEPDPQPTRRPARKRYALADD